MPVDRRSIRCPILSEAVRRRPGCESSFIFVVVLLDVFECHPITIMLMLIVLIEHQSLGSRCKILFLLPEV